MQLRLGYSSFSYTGEASIFNVSLKGDGVIPYLSFSLGYAF